MRPLPHAYTNDARTDGTTVVKRYTGPAAATRRATERSVLDRLPGSLPIPRPRPGRGDTLILPLLPGVPGQELIAAGHAAEVLHSCGTLLRRLQELDPAAVFPATTGAVLVHGDFGPNNMLLDPATFAVTGLVDWEWAHAGDPIEDLAWCEWIVRMHHPEHRPALDALFAGYGSRPAWPVRHAAQIERCQHLLELVRDHPEGAAAVPLWTNRIATTRSWTE